MLRSIARIIDVRCVRSSPVDGSGQEICTRLRDSILRYRARVPKEGPEVKEFLTDKDSMLKFFSFIKVQSELFKKHDHLVDEIAGDLKNETLTFKERLESIRNHLM